MTIRIISSRERVPGHRFDTSGISLSIDARSWEGASAAMINCKRYQPDGYSLLCGEIVRRGSKGGRRCQLRLHLRHTNPRFPVLVDDELEECFSTEIRLCETKLEYEPKDDSSDTVEHRVDRPASTPA